MCEIYNHFLLPDLGLNGFKESGIFDDFEVDELVWLNAKDVEIVYECMYCRKIVKENLQLYREWYIQLAVCRL